MDDERSEQDDSQRLVNIALDEHTVVRRSAEVEHERAVAIYDLLEENTFAPVGDFQGPYSLHLSIEENRLKLDVRSEAEQPVTTILLALTPFRRLVKDYFTVCETYFEAIRTASPSRIEAIDMGRRALHNEGSELLRDRLDGKAEIDLGTARRLFTLICVLHIRG
jgi:uncharacterized protein (UPF0262 family)